MMVGGPEGSRWNEIGNSNPKLQVRIWSIPESNSDQYP